DVVLRLEDATRRTLARAPERLARHDRVFLVGPHVELLNFVPVLRLVDRAAQLAEPRGRVELEVLGLIRASVAGFGLIRSAAPPARSPVCCPIQRLLTPAQLPVRSGCPPIRGVGADVFVGGSCRANRIAGAFVVTFIAFCTLGGTGATT